MWAEILIGISASFVASLIWWFFTQLYSVGARSKINYLLISARDESIAYEKYLQYNDYDNALATSQRIIDKIGEVYMSIKPLTYFCRKKRLLINTLLNNVYIMANSFKAYHIGYKGDVEKEACCEKAFRHLYIVGFENDPNSELHPDPIKFEPATSVSLKLLIDLNIRCQSVEQIMGSSYCFNNSSESIEKRKKKLIDLTQYIHPFKDDYSKSVAIKYHITTNVFTRKQYNKIVANIKTKKKAA